MNGNPLPPKKEVALALLERGSVHVHLDPRAAGVVVPAWFKRQPQLVLQVGLNMPVPIPDLRVDDDGMSCTLSFNRSPFFCIVPWSSVYAMVGDDGRGMVWPEDVPPEVALQAKAREAEPAAKKPAAARGLAVVKSPTEAPRKTATRATAKPRAARGDGTETSKAKKPRGKKARDGALDRTADGAGATLPSTPAGEGVLIPIAAPAAKPGAGQRAGAHRRSERTPASPPSVDPPTAPKPVTEHARPQATAPGRAGVGKTKREIPPYLRVVK